MLGQSSPFSSTCQQESFFTSYGKKISYLKTKMDQYVFGCIVISMQIIWLTTTSLLFVFLPWTRKTQWWENPMFWSLLFTIIIILLAIVLVLYKKKNLKTRYDRLDRLQCKGDECGRSINIGQLIVEVYPCGCVFHYNCYRKITYNKLVINNEELIQICPCCMDIRKPVSKTSILFLTNPNLFIN